MAKQQIDVFLDSLQAKVAPQNAGPLLIAVWHGLRGEWDQAHDIAQEDDSSDAAWIHAWLHRQEGDLANAGYWYRRAKRPVEKDRTFSEEGRLIAEFLLGR